MNSHDYYITPAEYEAAALIGIRPALLEVRIRTLAWSKQRAMTTPPHKKKPLKDWVEVAEANGICYSTLRYRANRLGWDIERAATQPLQDRKAQAKRAYEASRKYPVEFYRLAVQNGIEERTFHRRMKNGWDPHTAATRAPITPRECGLMTKAKRNTMLRFFPHRKGVLHARTSN
ncbi:hypothetical protein ACFFSY_29260 [Paenibacillus aurantiacus]|uniref:Helix-turn-helix domain-containing protein n=1 Tax=Paenibacillus aurantiacus TaxID=1936118 RepID=A0ABV5KXY2_9BACL